MTTVEEYEDLIYSTARYHGQPFIEWNDRAKLRAFINTELQSIMEEFKLIYDDNVTFDTTASDDGTYDLLDTATSSTNPMSSPVLEPEIVLVEDVPLLDRTGVPGLISVAEANFYVYEYRTQARAQPQHACLITPRFLRLIPRPDAAYDVTISGWVHHFDLTGDGVADVTDMNLDAQSVKGSAEAIAGQLILVGAQGPSLEAALALIQRGKSRLTKASGRAASFVQGPTVRGSRRSSIYTLS